MDTFYQLSGSPRVYCMNDAEDVELVRKCAAGNTLAFGELVERYTPQVFSATYRILWDREEAADATQQAFLKAFENLGSYDERKRFFTWLYTIAVRTALNAARQRRDHEELDEDEPSTGALDHDGLESNDRQRIIRTALSRLPADLRAPLVLFHYDDCSYREIAELVGTTEARVRSRIFEARKRMKKLLERSGYERD